jgi:hypothetical protein
LSAVLNPEGEPAPSPFLEWAPAGTIVENVPRAIGGLANQTPLVSGTLFLVGGLVIPAGELVSTITFEIGAVAVTPTHGWFCLIDAATLAVLGKTADDGATVWAANTPKSLGVAAPFTLGKRTPAYAGICSVAATPTGLACSSSFANLSGLAPALSGASNAGLTDPASLPSPVTAIAVGSNRIPYVALS